MKYIIEEWIADYDITHDSDNVQGYWRECGTSNSRLCSLQSIFELRSKNPNNHYRLLECIDLF